MYETCPHDNMTIHIALGNLLLMPCTILSGLSIGPLIDLIGYRPVFAILAGISLFALFWLSVMFKEPRKLKVRSTKSEVRFWLLLFTGKYFIRFRLLQLIEL